MDAILNGKSRSLPVDKTFRFVQPMHADCLRNQRYGRRHAMLPEGGLVTSRESLQETHLVRAEYIVTTLRLWGVFF